MSYVTWVAAGFGHGVRKSSLALLHGHSTQDRVRRGHPDDHPDDRPVPVGIRPARRGTQREQRQQAVIPLVGSARRRRVRLAHCVGVRPIQSSPVDRPSFVGPLRAKWWGVDDWAGPASQTRHRPHSRKPTCCFAAILIFRCWEFERSPALAVPARTYRAGLGGRDPRLPRHQWLFQWAHRGRQPTHQEGAVGRARLPQLRQLSAVAALRHQMADSPNHKTARPLPTLGGVEPPIHPLNSARLLTRVPALQRLEGGRGDTGRKRQRSVG
jgi:hypothetical protein